MSRVRLSWLAGFALLACSSSPLRGGYSRPDALLHGTQVLASFIPTHCQDAEHTEHTPRFSAVDLIETQTGRTVLVEHRQGHDLLVAENFHDEGAFWVFEVVVAPDRLRRWRIPRSKASTGSVAVGRELGEVRRGERFEAGLASAHLTCSLVPKASSPPLGTSSSDSGVQRPVTSAEALRQ